MDMSYSKFSTINGAMSALKDLRHGRVKSFLCPLDKFDLQS